MQSGRKSMLQGRPKRCMHASESTTSRSDADLSWSAKPSLDMQERR